MSRKADGFSKAKMLEMNVSEPVRCLSGASREALENNFELPLTPMKDYAQAVEKYSGANLEAFKSIFAQDLVPMQNYAENVKNKSQTFMKLVDRGFDYVLDSNEVESVKLSEKARAKIVEFKPAENNLVSLSGAPNMFSNQFNEIKKARHSR